MECPICLELIGPSTIIGRIQDCLHIYHQSCVVQWLAHLNLCPTCRHLYHGVEIVAHDKPTQVIERIAIKDKLLGTDAIDSIPAEFVIPPPVYGSSSRHNQEPLEDAASAQNGVCLICSSAQYSLRRSTMLSCISCGGHFHLACLGHRSEPAWFCPICDCHQEVPLASQPASARHVPVIARPASPRYRPLPVVARSTSSARGGRLLLLENLEIENFESSADPADWDDEFAAQRPTPRYVGTVRPRAPWNGGILLRRQARELENLTAEERSAWSILENARSGNTATDVKDADSHTDTQRKRRRPRTRGLDIENRASGKRTDAPGTDLGTDPGTTLGAYPDAGSSFSLDLCPNQTNGSEIMGRPGRSRIALLINQIKSRPVTRPSPDTFAVESVSPLSVRTHGPMSSLQRLGDRLTSLDCCLQSLASTSPISDSDLIDTRSIPRPLTFEEKLMVQTHVRNILRPLYRGEGLNKRRISSEEEYVCINKSLSRQIYSHISSLCTMQGPQVYKELFQGGTNELKNLVDAHVQGWSLKQA